MCGQWSETGYIKNRKDNKNEKMQFSDWKRLVDEIAENNITSVLIRGGEPFLYPQIIELLEYINNKGIFISIDSNGTLLEKYARDIIRIGNIHITVSLDGTPDIHDRERNVPGCFEKIKQGLLLMNELEINSINKISRSICFTISPWSYRAMGEMPGLARELYIKTIAIIPYCYITGDAGKAFEKELQELFNCKAFSWKGFHHDSSGVDIPGFNKQLEKYRTTLGDIYSYPYLPLSDYEYEQWFKDGITPVGPMQCSNTERLIDIQPGGEANFCVDIIDYSFGNAREKTIKELWNSREACDFREYRRNKRLAGCYRCVAKYMGHARDDKGVIKNIIP